MKYLLRDIFRGLQVDLRNVEELFNSISAEISGSKVITSLNLTKYLGIRLGDELLLDVRISSAVVEVYVSGKLLDRLDEVGLPELYKVLEKYAPGVRSVAISKALPSSSLYLVIQGDGITLPNTRLTIFREFFDVSSSFCRISTSENTYAFLLDILELGRKYFEEFFK